MAFIEICASSTGKVAGSRLTDRHSTASQTLAIPAPAGADHWQDGVPTLASIVTTNLL